MDQAIQKIAENQNVFFSGLLIGWIVPLFVRNIFDLVIDLIAILRGYDLKTIKNWQEKREHWRRAGATS